MIPPRIKHQKIAFSNAALWVVMLTSPAAAQIEGAQQPQLAGAVWMFDDWRPTVSSPGGRFTMTLRARLQLDAALFDQEGTVDDVTPERDVQFKDLKSGVITRRAYLGVEGRAFGDFWYEYRMDFGVSKLAIANPIINLAHISYNIGDVTNLPASHFRINAGIIKPIFTYADSTSSAALTFLERADVVNVATSNYGGGTPRLGIELTFQQLGILHSGDNFAVSGAFTGQHALIDNTVFPANATYEDTHILGRIAYRLWSDGVAGLQIGGSASRILTRGGARTITLRDLPEIRVDGSHLVSSGVIPANGGSLWGLESAANIRNFYITSEYYKFGIVRDTRCAGCIVAGDPEFSGWYIQASWILTGETKVYQAYATNNDIASFANPRVSQPLSLDRQSWGAWEIAARFSDLDLNWHQGTLGTTCIGAAAGCIRGGEQKIWTIGLNWYLSNEVRLMLDYMLIDVSKLNGAGQQVGQEFNAVGTRLQFTN